MDISSIEPTERLQELATRINEEHCDCTSATNVAVQHAVVAGRLLIEAKAICAHGEWHEWLGTNFAGSVRTAQTYMRLAENWALLESNAQNPAHLTLDKAFALIADARCEDKAKTQASRCPSVSALKQTYRRYKANSGYQASSPVANALSATTEDGKPAEVATSYAQSAPWTGSKLRISTQPDRPTRSAAYASRGSVQQAFSEAKSAAGVVVRRLDALKALTTHNKYFDQAELGVRRILEALDSWRADLEASATSNPPRPSYDHATSIKAV